MRDDRHEHNPPQRGKLIFGWLVLLCLAGAIVALGYLAKQYI